MSDNPNFGADSSGVQAHLSIIQGVIQRMAENSRSCKLWCITLVSAVLFFSARSGSADNSLIALVPLSLFLVLDTYYLALERAFRTSYNLFIGKLHNESVTLSDLYQVRPVGSIPKIFFKCLLSFSIYIFYLPLALAMVLVWYLFIRGNCAGISAFLN